MLQKRKTLLFFLCLLGIQIGLQTDLLSKSWSEIMTMKRTISLATIGAAAVGIYKFGPRVYTAVQDKINAEINEEFVRSLKILLTPNCFINQLDHVERNEKFQKKARLMNSKNRIQTTLEACLDSSNTQMSHDHKKQLKQILNKTKFVFDSVNFIDSGMSFLIRNPYSSIASEPGYIDQFIENKIIQSIIKSSKPLTECTPEEKLQRIESKQAIKKLIKKQMGTMSEAIFAQIDQIMDLLFD